MKIQELSINTTYIPEWNNNREQEPSEQIVIEFKTIPNSLNKNKYVSFIFKDDKISIYKDYSLFVYSFVKEIKNLYVGNKQIKTAEELVDIKNSAIVSF